MHLFSGTMLERKKSSGKRRLEHPRLRRRVGLRHQQRLTLPLFLPEYRFKKSSMMGLCIYRYRFSKAASGLHAASTSLRVVKYVPTQSKDAT
jgi:hypothetical protein